jgi:pyridoxine 5-phosphate synthase
VSQQRPQPTERPRLIQRPRLSVNVDHVATLRQARGTVYPDPLDAARLAIRAGAHGITTHLRCDRRHIQDHDVERIGAAGLGKLNLEISVEREMLDIALATRPEQVTLVPERPDEVTTEGGLDLLIHRKQGERVRDAARRLVDSSIAVSVFLDPDTAQIDRLAELLHGVATGFEINTDAYTKVAESGSDAGDELEKVRRAAAHGVAVGFEVYAGHGLTPGNVAPVAALPEVEELNIGHALVSRAVLVGMEEAVREFLREFPV